MSADIVLDRVHNVRETRHNTWIASCPAHEDRNPSLSIRELEDGRILLHCFGACETHDILAAVGLNWSDLFPPRQSNRPPFQYGRRIPAAKLLELLSEEVDVVALVAADFLAGKTISEVDWHRLAQAAARIGRARVHVRG